MPTVAEYFARPRIQKPRYIIDPVAFFVALIGGPILFTVATFWLLFIPVFALGIGGAPYLVLGTPVLLFYLSRHPARPSDLATLALIIHACFCIGLSLGALLTKNEAALGGILFTLIFGVIFAPAWAASFGWVYRKLCRDLYAHPIPV